MTSHKKYGAALILATIACCLCLLGAVALAAVLPQGATAYLSDHEPRLMEHITYIIAMLYVAIVIAVAVLVLLLLLLRVVHREQIFTPVSGRLVTAIALLVILEGLVFGLLGLVYPPAVAVMFVAVTMGLCFLVVSRVLAEATAIKSENDATI